MIRTTAHATARALLAALLLAAAPAWSQTAAIERVEPPHWWVGMRDTRLELMVHGPGIATAHVRLRKAPAGVRLRGSSRLDGDNYLFVDLDIGAAARPGTLTLDFIAADGKPVATQVYELRARTPGSAQRQGFDGRDAIYLVVPDRFANGDPGNDNAGGLGDTVDRANVDARHGGDIKGLAERLDYIAGLASPSSGPRRWSRTVSRATAITAIRRPTSTGSTRASAATRTTAGSSPRRAPRAWASSTTSCPTTSARATGG